MLFAVSFVNAKFRRRMRFKKKTCYKLFSLAGHHDKALAIRYPGGGGGGGCVYRIEKNNRALKFFEKNN